MAPGHGPEDRGHGDECDQGGRERERGLRLTRLQAAGARSSATTVGMADWKTIAPVMFPMASVSLPWRTHSTLLNFSGSSVAIGAMTSDSSSSLTPERGRQMRHRPDEQVGPADDAGERREHLHVDDPEPGRRRVRPVAPRGRGGGT